MASSPFRLRPSAAHRWVNCYGSVALEALYPQDESESAREGTAAHHVGAEMLVGRFVDEDTAAPNGVVVTEEMIDGAALLAETALSLIPANLMNIEFPVAMPGIHPDNGGTPDIWGMGFETWVLHVIDYKFGHEFVDAFENWQCIDYVHGVVEHLAVEWGRSWFEIEQSLTVQITVVQPRSYHADGPVRSWRVKLSDLRGHFNILKHAAERATQPNAETRTGPWCDHCEARAHCPALQSTAYRITDGAGTATPFDLTPYQVGRELTWLKAAAKLLDARIDGLEEEAKAMVGRGNNVHGWRYEHAFANLTWSASPEEVAALGEMLGVEVFKAPALRTPTQVKNDIKRKKVDEAVINEYSYRPRKAAALIPFDERATRKIFSGE